MPYRLCVLLLCCRLLPLQSMAQSPREADVMWSRVHWRVIDLREKQNRHLYYPIQAEGNRNLAMVILDALLIQRTVAAYDPLYDDFRIKLSLPEIANIWTEVLHKTVQRSSPPYTEYDTLFVKRLDPSSVKRIKIKEYVYFDTRLSRMETRIIGICPVMERHDPETGELRGYSDMFWIYFPELSPALALQKITLGLGNALQSISYDDVFRKHYFSSYLYKEDNVYDRRIEDYVRSSMDGLLESERIKEQIRLYEEDIWEQ